MQQTLTPPSKLKREHTLGFPLSLATSAVSWEVLAYLGLLLFALAVRFAELDSVPISPIEAPDALAAWRSIFPYADALTAEASTTSPLVFWAQQIGFTLFGNGEFSARVFTALAGVALAFSPLLFRADLGRARAFALSVLLVFSPVVMLASRFSDGMIWASLAAVVMLWGFRYYWRTHSISASLVAMVCIDVLLFLSAPGGVMLALILALTFICARLLLTLDALDETANPSPFGEVVQRVRQMPIVTGVGVAVLVVIAISTHFMLYPMGISGIGQLLNGFFSGWLQPLPHSARLLPVSISLYYEPLLWVLALIAVVTLAWARALAGIDRFFLLWLVFGLVASALFAGATAAHALWLTLPLVGLASGVVTRFFEDGYDPLWEELHDDVLGEVAGVRWSKWILALLALMLLVMLTLHLQVVGREIIKIPDGDIWVLLGNLAQATASAPLRVSILWTFITLMFMLIGGLLAASVWGNRTTAQAAGVGLTLFMLINATSLGWTASVFEADNPAHPWHHTATSHETVLLRRTLLDLAERETMGYLHQPVTVVVDEAAGLTRDGVVAWLLRDFHNVTFVDDVIGARGHEVVIMTDRQEDVDLGGAYVGKPVTIERTWSRESMIGSDAFPWWLQREVRTAPTAHQMAALWVRFDIYQSAPITGS